MNILMVTERLPFSFRWDPRYPQRGSEKFYVETAKHLALLGHDVQVEMEHISSIIRLEGVEYCPRGDARNPPDAVLLCNWRGSYHSPVPEARIVRWTAFADFRLKDITFRDCDAQIVISNYAAELAEEGTADSPDLYVVPLGIDKEFWTPGSEPRENTCLYTSSPDRGGAWLQSEWKNIYNLTGYDLTCSPYPGSGKEPWSADRLRNEYREAKYWLHPGMGRELFCLSGAEAQACGTVPIIVPHEGLHETIRWGHRFSADRYLEGLVSVLQATYVSGPNADHLLSWAEATKKLEEVLKS